MIRRRKIPIILCFFRWFCHPGRRKSSIIKTFCEIRLKPHQHFYICVYVNRNDERMIDEPTVQTRLSSPSREAKYIQGQRSSWRKKILNQVNGGSWVVANPSTPRPKHNIPAWAVIVAAIWLETDSVYSSVRGWFASLTFICLPHTYAAMHLMLSGYALSAGGARTLLINSPTSLSFLIRFGSCIFRWGETGSSATYSSSCSSLSSFLSIPPEQ